MLENAVQANIDPLKFWNYTPYEIQLLVDKYIKNERNKDKDIISLAWYTEAIHRARKLPDLKKLLQVPQQKKKMTPEEMLNKVKMLNSALGGDINGCS